MRKLLIVPPVIGAVIAIWAIGAGAHGGGGGQTEKVKVPHADRFGPFAVTIHAGDKVRWVNNDEDDHTVVSDDAFDTAGHKNTDELLGANGGKVSLKFNHPGTFVYYCRFHAHLNGQNQPIAPGPDGGIEDNTGNFGTPMMGVVTVLPKHG